MNPSTAHPTPSRRTVVRTAAWAAPTVAVAAAAPAFADSRALWSIASNSFEGLATVGDSRSDYTGIGRFNFTIAVPAGVALGTVQVQVQFLTGTTRAGAHVEGYNSIAGASANHGAWSLQGSNRGDMGSSYFTFTFRRPTTVNAAASTLSLSFNTSAMMDTDVEDGSTYATITFSSGNRTNGPDRVFKILPQNNASRQIVVPI
ncbi:hypothetical protein [Nocardioides yefusunii]|uniref:DNRLRE domain-containing protein n=1 Tax=Nocardioides yefusunii TaxID=2500546 RepID=A0ABW1QTL3_9ACTN|nr:hypothetical protein [Nocardioides yefusunii]